jgi:glycosyltransferase involved in cell wall biosynthesis
MRVLHLVPALYGPDGRVVGGAERYALELARHMADVVPTRLLSFGAEDLSQKVGALAVKVIGRPWHVRGQPFNPLAPALFREVLKPWDVVHCHQQHVLASSLTALLCRLRGRRVFCTEHGGGGWDISGYVSTDRWYHGHLHNSCFSRRVYGREDMPRAHVILGGVDSAKFSPNGPGDAWRPRPALFVGRLLPHKGVNYLVEAVPPELPLEIHGSPSHAGYYELLQGLARGKQVRFLTGSTDAELVAAYRRALCVVLPSVYRNVYGQETAVPELLGQTLLEGMACGLPAICTAVAAMPEVVVDGVTGFVVPPNDPVALRDKLCWLRDHPQEMHALGRAARQRVLEVFNWPGVVRRCLEIYRQA